MRRPTPPQRIARESSDDSSSLSESSSYTSDSSPSPPPMNNARIIRETTISEIDPNISGRDFKASRDDVIVSPDSISEIDEESSEEEYGVAIKSRKSQ